MTEFSLFNLKIINHSPLLVGSTGMTHNLYDTLKFIPNTTLRGAFATKVLETYCTQQDQAYGKCEPCDKKNNCPFYSLFFKHPFSITNGIYKKSLIDDDSDYCKHADFIPVHPFIQQCKVCRGPIVNKLEEWIKRNYVISTCPQCNNKTTMKSLEKYICRNCDNAPKDPKIGFTTSTSVNRKTRSSLEKYLFRYSYIEPESVFECAMFLEKNSEIESFLKSLDFLRLGRSKSRGFGKVSIALESIDLEKRISYNKDVIKDMIQRKNKILISAKTNVFQLEAKPKTSYAFVSTPEFDLRKAVLRSLLFLNHYQEDIVFTTELENTAGSSSVISGWSYKTQQPKPHFYSSSPGSVYKFTITPEQINDNILQALSYLEFIGIDQYSQLGYNLIYFPNLKQKAEVR